MDPLKNTILQNRGDICVNITQKIDTEINKDGNNLFTYLINQTSNIIADVLNKKGICKKEDPCPNLERYVCFMCTGKYNVKLKDFKVLTDIKFKQDKYAIFQDKLEKDHIELEKIDTAIFKGLIQSNKKSGLPIDTIIKDIKTELNTINSNARNTHELTEISVKYAKYLVNNKSNLLTNINSLDVDKQNVTLQRYIQTSNFFISNTKYKKIYNNPYFKEKFSSNINKIISILFSKSGTETSDINSVGLRIISECISNPTDLVTDCKDYSFTDSINPKRIKTLTALFKTFIPTVSSTTTSPDPTQQSNSTTTVAAAAAAASLNQGSINQMSCAYPGYSDVSYDQLNENHICTTLPTDPNLRWRKIHRVKKKQDCPKTGVIGDICITNSNIKTPQYMSNSGWTPIPISDKLKIEAINDPLILPPGVSKTVNIHGDKCDSDYHKMNT